MLQLHSGLLQHLLKLGLELVALQQPGGQQPALLLGLNQGRPPDAPALAFLALLDAQQAALELVQVGVPKRVRDKPTR